VIILCDYKTVDISLLGSPADILEGRLLSAVVVRMGKCGVWFISMMTVSHEKQHCLVWNTFD